MPGVARIVCDGFVAGRPSTPARARCCARQSARLAEKGWHLRTGIEPEFFLLRRDGGRWRPADPQDRLDKPSYDLKSLPRRRLPAGLQQALQRCGLDVLQLDHEDAHGQYEVNFGHDDALTSADHLMLFKLAGACAGRRHTAWRSR
jgi:glutamine synthetase